MKILRRFVTAVIIIIIAIALIVTRPTENDFAEWYVEQNQTGLGGLIDGAFELVVKEKTETKDCLFFSIFEVNGGEDRYVGILDHIFGRSSAERVQETLENLVEQAKDFIDE